MLSLNTMTANLENEHITRNLIEEEKDLPSKSKFSVINRDLDLYFYEITIGSSLGITPNISKAFGKKFKNGNFLSLVISTPYKTPKIINRYQFNISSEICLKNFPAIHSVRKGINIISIYLLLGTKQKGHLNITYGLGFSQLFRSNIKILTPSFKTKIEHQINFLKVYTFLIENDFIAKNKKAYDFLEQKLRLSVGLSPELITSYPYMDIDGDTPKNFSTMVDFYLKLNLFNL